MKLILIVALIIALVECRYIPDYHPTCDSFKVNIFNAANGQIQRSEMYLSRMDVPVDVKRIANNDIDSIKALITKLDSERRCTVLLAIARQYLEAQHRLNQMMQQNYQALYSLKNLIRFW